MTQDLPDTPAPAEPSAARPRRLRWILIGALTVLLLVGAGIGYGVYAMRDRPMQRFVVTIHLDPGVSAGKRAVVEEHLRELDATVQPSFRDVDELAERMGEFLAEDPESLDRLSDTKLPAMMIALYELPEFDCDVADAVRASPGVIRIQVERFALGEPVTRRSLADRFICT
jgi:hypothetical protein